MVGLQRLGGGERAGPYWRPFPVRMIFRRRAPGGDIELWPFQKEIQRHMFVPGFKCKREGAIERIELLEIIQRIEIVPQQRCLQWWTRSSTSRSACAPLPVAHGASRMRASKTCMDW